MKNISLCFYEDHGFTNFGPLTDTRPVWALRCGAFTLGEKLLRQFQIWKYSIILRDSLTSSYIERKEIERKERPELPVCTQFNSKTQTETVLFVNGQAKFNGTSIKKLKNESDEVVYTLNQQPAAIRLSSKNLDRIRWINNGQFDQDSIRFLKRRPIEGRFFNYPWELVNQAESEIAEDLDMVRAYKPGSQLSFPEYVTVRNPANIESTGDIRLCPGLVIDAQNSIVRLENGSTLGPGVILDARSGPIWIDENADIQAGAILIGPVYIGSDSIVRPGARLSSGVCLGPHCRLGGEISNTIIIGYSAKQHSGYIGTSYIGEWVNLGATTDNSDLKNNYRPVEVQLRGVKINTGSLHFGVVIGDFCRTAIQTRLNTGTIIGTCCNIFGPDFPDKAIPSFTWFGSNGYQEYRIKKALETISVVMPRRGRKLTPALKKLLQEIFNASALDRERFLSL